MFLDQQNLAELVAWRRNLHRNPELSGEEKETARTVQNFLSTTGADIITGVGGHGILAIYQGEAPGPTIMLRAELDGLPIQEASLISHRSVVPGKAHLCGHDGHMTILAGVARGLGRKRPRRGRAVLLFQPAEEDGTGAAAVIADRKFQQVQPDFVFSLHNLPGVPLGKVAISEGLVNCASRGMRIALSGRTAHASNPELGVSPQQAVVRLLSEVTTLGSSNPSPIIHDCFIRAGTSKRSRPSVSTARPGRLPLSEEDRARRR